MALKSKTRNKYSEIIIEKMRNITATKFTKTIKKQSQTTNTDEAELLWKKTRSCRVRLKRFKVPLYAQTICAEHMKISSDNFNRSSLYSNKAKNQTESSAKTVKEIKNKDESHHTGKMLQKDDAIAAAHIPLAEKVKTRYGGSRAEPPKNQYFTNNKSKTQTNKNSSVKTKPDSVKFSRRLRDKKRWNHTAETNTSVQDSATKILEKQSKHSRNIASNSNLIEQLLNDDNFEQNLHTTEQKMMKCNLTEKNSEILKISNLNLNRSNQNSDKGHNTNISPKQNIIFRSKVKQMSTKKIIPKDKPKVFTKDKKLRYSKKLATKNDSIYEFLSQSQTLDSSNAKAVDPAADIIKKLIEQGKVAVATNRKGSGRPIIKRKLKTNQKPQRKQIQKSQRIITKTQNVVKTLQQKNNEPLIADSEYDDECGEPAINQSGAFSSLARSVLIHEANKQNSNSAFKIQEQRRLLVAARKLVSTPIRKSCVDPLSTTINLSPVQLASNTTNPQPSGGASPWRVNEAQLPTAFNFSCNSSQLPSFSSEHITATPRKKTRKQHSVQFFSENQEDINSPTSIEEPLSIPSSQNVNLSSSFEKNNSNEENIAPVNAVCNNVLPQPLNPKSNVKNRSPLKALNILEVINLPPWTNVSDKHNTSKANSIQKEHSRESSASSTRAENSIENLFGFTELLDDSENIDDVHKDFENVKSSTNTNRNPREVSNLKSKLKSLKKWRPNIEELPRPSDLYSNNVFETRRAKQKRINDMLCSTMINEPKSTSSGVLNDKNKPLEDAALFNDIQLDKSPDNKKPFRTYARPVRKRKIRHNFIMFPISDVSDISDEEENVRAEKENNEHKHKRPRKEKEHNNNPELDSFINDFNNMCEEVDQYNLMTEKSA